MKICAAAVKYTGKRKTVLVSGSSHVDCEDYARDMEIAAGIELTEVPVKGFVTSDLTFKDRVEALEIVKEQGQMKDGFHDPDRLMSYMLDLSTVPSDKRYLLGTGIVGLES